VLGGGATAASLLLALSELGCRHARLLVRDPARAAETVAAVARHDHGPVVEVGLLTDAIGSPDVLASTIPAAAETPELVAAAAAAAVVFDVIYDPWPTPLAAAAAGRPLVGDQAALQVRLMTGQEAPLAAMRTAGEDALAARATGDPR
jgi:shikimate dehydrogenase